MRWILGILSGIGCLAEQDELATISATISPGFVHSSHLAFQTVHKIHTIHVTLGFGWEILVKAVG